MKGGWDLTMMQYMHNFGVLKTKHVILPSTRIKLIHFREQKHEQLQETWVYQSVTDIRGNIVQDRKGNLITRQEFHWNCHRVPSQMNVKLRLLDQFFLIVRATMLIISIGGASQLESTSKYVPPYHAPFILFRIHTNIESNHTKI